MNLDDPSLFTQIDTQDYLAEIDGLPHQLQRAWELGQQQPLPAWSGFQRVVIAGMGGSAISADLLSAYAVQSCPLPVVVHRSYNLPAWARGPETLLIASSHSGNTDETLAAFQTGLERGCRIWLTPPPFDHAKMMVVDEGWCMLGSSNWDPRSLRAAALDRPLVALFGSSSFDYTPPMSPQARIVSLRLECSPCFRRDCPLGTAQCLEELSPERVLAALRS